MPKRNRKTHRISRWIYRVAEFLPAAHHKSVRKETRGVYALLRGSGDDDLFDVVYVGVSSLSIRGRLADHFTSDAKRGWTHFSIFEVWPNVSEDDLLQLEGLLRHIYRKDSRANGLNAQKRSTLLRKVRDDDISNWKQVPLAGPLGRSRRKRTPK